MLIQPRVCAPGVAEATERPEMPPRARPISSFFAEEYGLGLCAASKRCEQGGGALCLDGVLSNGPAFVYLCPMLGLAASHAIMLGFGLRYTLDAMRNDECRAAMVAASPAWANAPLLGILGWCYVGIDAVEVLGLSGCMLALLYVDRCL